MSRSLGVFGAKQIGYGGSVILMSSNRLTVVFPKKNWDSVESLDAVAKLSPKDQEDLCTILLDTKGHQPELLKVPKIPKTVGIPIDMKMLQDLNSILGTILVQSDPEMMACLRESQVAKKKGDYRKFEDIARECGI
jgi:hypothetical protein